MTAAGASSTLTLREATGGSETFCDDSLHVLFDTDSPSATILLGEFGFQSMDDSWRSIINAANRSAVVFTFSAEEHTLTLYLPARCSCATGEAAVIYLFDSLGIMLKAVRQSEPRDSPSDCAFYLRFDCRADSCACHQVKAYLSRRVARRPEAQVLLKEPAEDRTVEDINRLLTAEANVFHLSAPPPVPPPPLVSASASASAPPLASPVYPEADDGSPESIVDERASSPFDESSDDEPNDESTKPPRVDESPSPHSCTDVCCQRSLMGLFIPPANSPTSLPPKSPPRQVEKRAKELTPHDPTSMKSSARANTSEAQKQKSQTRVPRMW